LKQFVLTVLPNAEGIIRLYEGDYHYLVRVRRLKTGMDFDAILPGGKETRVRILSTVDNILIGECMEKMENTPPGLPPDPLSGPLLEPLSRPMPGKLPPIALFQGLPKGTKMDLIVRQAAEGGVSIVAPFESEYSTVHLASDSGKTKRWERIVKEARQQSGSTTETKILPPCGFETLLEYWKSQKEKYKRPLGILFHQEPLEKGSFHDYLGKYPDFIALAVGPEGGFSPREVELFKTAGFRPLLMGNTILRTETAALYGTAAIRIILMESESWIPRPAAEYNSSTSQ